MGTTSTLFLLRPKNKMVRSLKVSLLWIGISCHWIRTDLTRLETLQLHSSIYRV